MLFTPSVSLKATDMLLTLSVLLKSSVSLKATAPVLTHKYEYCKLIRIIEQEL